MTDAFTPQSSTLITGGAIHKVTREYRALAGEDEHPASDWVHNPNATLVASDEWKLNVAEDALVEMTAQEKTDWTATKARRKTLGSAVSAVALDPVVEPVVPGSSKIVANDRPAVEVQDGVTGWGAIQSLWRHAQAAGAMLCCRVSFILKASGTGTKVRIAARAKAQHIGDDSSAAFDDTEFVVVTVTHTTVGEVFEACVELDASGFELGDAIALQVGRDGNNELGAGANDDVDVAVQLIGLQTRVM